MHKQFEVNQHAIILDNSSKALILKRDNKWLLAGGRLEDDDTPQEGLLREIQEETGLTSVKVGQALYVDLSSSKKTLLLIYRCLVEADQPEVQLSEEHTEARWVEVDELDGLEFEFEIIKDLIRDATYIA